MMEESPSEDSALCTDTAFGRPASGQAHNDSKCLEEVHVRNQTLTSEADGHGDTFKGSKTYGDVTGDGGHLLPAFLAFLLHLFQLRNSDG